MLEFLKPVEHFGHKFDRGMTLYEFSALREPERTDFPRIGAWLRSKGIEFNEVPTPQIIWRGQMWPDLYIANQLDAVPEGWHGHQLLELHPSYKSIWHDNFSLEIASLQNHGKEFHDAFIDPMCLKITGESSANICAKYHRAVWLPVYWNQTLRARESIPTKFYYPTEGYAGIVQGSLSAHSKDKFTYSTGYKSGSELDLLHRQEISLAYCLAEPLKKFSVLFVVDESPIYRITNMDVCAGTPAITQRLIVEYRGECDVHHELERLGLARVSQSAYASMKMTLPTIENVLRGWKPRPNINRQLWEILYAETTAQ